MMDINTHVDPAVFDAAVLATVQGMISPERLHVYLRELDQEHQMLVDCAATDTSLQSQAHKIVSTAGMLGLTRMSESARALENACQSSAGPEAALLQCRAAAGDVRRFALPAIAVSTGP